MPEYTKTRVSTEIRAECLTCARVTSRYRKRTSEWTDVVCFNTLLALAKFEIDLLAGDEGATA